MGPSPPTLLYSNTPFQSSRHAGREELNRVLEVAIQIVHLLRQRRQHRVRSHFSYLVALLQSGCGVDQ